MSGHLGPVADWWPTRDARRLPAAFPFDRLWLRAARHSAGDQAKLAGLDEDRRDDFVLAIGELAANSTRHGSALDTLRVWVEDNVLVGEVSDAGRFGERPSWPGVVC